MPTPDSGGTGAGTIGSGRCRREGIAKLIGCERALRAYRPQRVLSSPYTRCVQTVTPLAGGLGLRTETSEHLAEGAGRQALALVRSLADDEVAVVHPRGRDH
jgi:phosphohistidine phosphatase SixA